MNLLEEIRIKKIPDLTLKNVQDTIKHRFKKIFGLPTKLSNMFRLNIHTSIFNFVPNVSTLSISFPTLFQHISIR